MKKNITGIPRKVKDYILKNRLVEPGDRLLLSLSAGKDSIALFDILHHLGSDLDISLAVFHLNHLTRGNDSDEDERFIEAMARRYGSDIHIEKHDFSTRPPGFSFEDYARRIRYEHLNSLAARHGYNRIATAHTASDNAETIMMRIFRGTGMTGLRGIEPERQGIVRPMLCLSSEEVYRHLRDRGIEWREDTSNMDTSYLRNFVRAQALPGIYERFPGGEDALINLGRSADEYHTLIRDMLIEKYHSLYDKSGDEIIVRYSRFGGDERILKYALSAAIREHFNEFVHRGMLGEIVKKCVSNRANMDLFSSKSISVKKTIIAGESVIHISGKTRKYAVSPVPWEYKVDLSGPQEKCVHVGEIGLSLKITSCDIRFFSENYLNPDILFIALPSHSAYIVIRNRLRGDRIRLSFGAKKVKELMIENKLDNRIKANIPLIDIDSQVAGIMFGLFSVHQNRVAEDFLVSKNTKRILAVCGAKPSPDREIS